jgi:hypothetical protein
MTALRKQRDRFTETSDSDEIILMRMDTGEFLSLSGTAAAIWKLIDGERDRDSLIEALEAEFAESAAGIAKDVDRLLGQLIGSGLLASE